jgi:hypothetical protein
MLIWVGIRLNASLGVVLRRLDEIEARVADQQRLTAAVGERLDESHVKVEDVRHLLVYGELPPSDEPTPALVRLLSWVSGVRRTGQVLRNGSGSHADG